MTCALCICACADETTIPKTDETTSVTTSRLKPSPIECRPDPSPIEVPTFVESQIPSGAETDYSLPVSVTIAYINDDPHADIVVSTTFSSSPDVSTPTSIWIHLGDGDGKFSRRHGPYLVGRGYLPITVVDIDGDGLDDIAIFHNVAIATPGGTLTETVSVPHHGGVLWADMNNDGLVDILDRRVDELVVRIGDGTGGFSAETVSSPVSLSTMWSRNILSGDVSGDGVADLVASDYVPDMSGRPVPTTLTVFVNNGAGAVVAESPTLFLGDDIQKFKLDDLNCDGKMDLIYLSSFYNQFDVRLREEAGWSAATRQTVVDRGIVWAYESGGTLASGDVDGNGAIDVIVAAVSLGDDESGSFSEYGAVTVFLGDGSGNLATVPPVVLHPAEPLAGPRYVTAGDLNNDGKSDLVVLDSRLGKPLSIWLSE